MSKSLSLRASELRLRKALLVDMPKDIERDFQIAADENARELLGAMRIVAPESDDKNPGQLKNSLRIERSDDGKRVKLIAGGRLAPHATYAEFGTRRSKASPFFWPTYRAKKRKILLRYSKVLTRAVKKYSA